MFLTTRTHPHLIMSSHLNLAFHLFTQDKPQDLLRLWCWGEERATVLYDIWMTFVK